MQSKQSLSWETCVAMMVSENFPSPTSTQNTIVLYCSSYIKKGETLSLKCLLRTYFTHVNTASFKYNYNGALSFGIICQV